MAGSSSLEGHFGTGLRARFSSAWSNVGCVPNDFLVLICQGLKKPEMETLSNLHYVCSFSGLVTIFIMLNFEENANDSV